MAELLQSWELQNQNHPETKETLVRTLDDLLERYLNLLHDYQALQSKLSEHFASGHLSLAQAKFSNSHRVRYGQDYYDERMQASCQVEVHSSNPNFVISNPQPLQCFDTEGTEDNNASTSEVTNVSNMGNEVAKSDRSVADPLRWFGILSPPALRSSQATFKVAVRDCVPRLASTVNEMRVVEIEVRRARKKLGKVR